MVGCGGCGSGGGKHRTQNKQKDVLSKVAKRVKVIIMTKNAQGGTVMEGVRE